jgi:hypothetical protein
MFNYKPGPEQMNLTAPMLMTQLRIVIAAFVMGVVVFTAIGAFTLLAGGPGGTAPSPNPGGGVPVAPGSNPAGLPAIAGLDPLTLVMFVLMFSMPMAYGFAVALPMQGKARTLWQNRTDDVVAGRAILNTFGARTITGAAMMESIGLFGGVVVYIRHDPLGFIGAGFALIALAVLFPTQSKLNAFIEKATGKPVVG